MPGSLQVWCSKNGDYSGIVLFDAVLVLDFLDDVLAELIFVATADDEVVNVHAEDHVTFLVFQDVRTCIADGSLES